MAPITASTEVARPAEEVFAYVVDPSTMPEWQQGALRGRMDGPTTRVGSRCTTVRKIGGREREVVTEITEYDPPRRWADRGIGGPILGPSSYFMKSPPVQYRDDVAQTLVEDFIAGK